MKLEVKSRKVLFSFLSISALILAAYGTIIESALPAATATLTTTSTPTPLPSSLATPTSSDHCVTIAYPQPRNAFRAWIELGRPEELVFQNLAGPDGDGNKRIVNRQTLPDLVHVEDSFCLLDK
jgi:hypothetical protein